MKPGTIVIAQAPGIVESKRRPSLVVSSEFYHSDRPDLILAIISTKIEKATSETDYILKDWKSAGLFRPSFVRMFLFSVVASNVERIGELSKQDWDAVQANLRLAVEV